MQYLNLQLLKSLFLKYLDSQTNHLQKIVKIHVGAQVVEKLIGLS